jgi:nucleoside-diphosphate-sugar epimerase
VLEEVSITDHDAVARIFAEHAPEYVVHFAAMPRVQYCQEHPTETNITNVIGTSTMLECAARAGVQRFVYSSSAAVYGTVATFPVIEDTHIPAPISFYGFQKYAGEPMCRMMSKYKGMDTACLRYFNVYGPHQDGTSSYATVISRWLDAIAQGKPICIEGDGTQSRDFVYIDDVVRANIAALTATTSIKGEACNIATNTQISLNEVKEKIEKAVGTTLTVEYTPAREGDIKHIRADITKAEQLLNWKPQTDFDTGLNETVKWYLHR